MSRKIFIKVMVMASVLILVIILGVLSIYWGAFWKTENYVHNLEGWVIDYDGSEVGSFVSEALLATSGPADAMTWTRIPASSYSNSTESMIDLVVSEKAWAVVSINAGATQKLRAAASAADGSYNGSQAITVYTNEARNENSYAVIMIPIIRGLMGSITARFGLQYGKELASSGNNLQNILANAPGVVSNPVSYTIYNTRPFDVPVATAVDFVGLIYLLIISFVITLQGNGARMASGVENRLSMRALIGLRVITPISMYFVLSCFFSMLSLAFQVPFGRVFGHSGFVIYWMLSWLGMCALGLAVEAMLTLLTIRFIPAFLIIWIISNVSVSYFPIVLLPGVYKYGYATPFYNVSRAVRTILFNTRNQVGLNFGVLIAWTVISICTISLFTYIMQRKNIRNREAMWRKEDERHEKGMDA